MLESNHESVNENECQKVIAYGDREEQVCHGTIEFDEQKGYAYCKRCRTIYRDRK